MLERPTGPFELRVPARAEHVATARLFSASLGRAVGMNEDQVGDLRLAVSEAVTAAIVAGGTSHVTLSGEISETALMLLVTPMARTAVTADRLDVASIVTALFPDTRFANGSIIIPIQIQLG